MMKKPRWSIATTVISALIASNLMTSPAHSADISGAFVHHVYFWLKNPVRDEDRRKLVEGLRAMTRIKTIKAYHIGVPASTDRPVIDRSYSVSWLLIFDNKADQDAYQADPIHLDFAARYSSVLCERVVVYDSEASE